MAKVNRATLHGEIFVEGCGIVPKTLSMANFGLNADLKMSVSANENFLILDLKGRDGKRYSISVPMTNVQYFTLE